MTSDANSPKPGVWAPRAVPTKPANPPINFNIQMPGVSPDEASAVLQARAAKESDFVGGEVEGAPSIVELARALQGAQTLPYSPQTFFEFVYNNIDFVPGYGVAKGSLGTLLDGCGNPFDQCCLLAALLRQVGFTVNYEVGNILLTPAQACAWLGVTDGNIDTAYQVLTDAGVFVSIYEEDEEDQLKIGHCWVKVNIGTEASPDWVVMDPSYKTFTEATTGIDLATATGYVQADFLSDAREGYSIDPDGNWVQNVNRTNIRADLQTYATNLVDWIRNYNATNTLPATMQTILGGRQTVPVTLPVTFPTSLSYEFPGDEPVEFTGDFSNTYKVTINMVFPGMDITLTSDQVYGHRLTWFYTLTSPDYYTPTLAIDGVVQTTATAQESGSYNSIYFTVDHPYPTTDANQSFYQTVFAPTEGEGNIAYLIGTSFGPAGKGLLDYHEALALENNFGASEFDEPALGETLAFQWANYCTQVTAVRQLLNSLSTTATFNHHIIGTASYQDYGYGISSFDIQGGSASTAYLNASVSNVPAVGIDIGMHFFAAEMLAIQQLTGIEALSETRDLDIANTDTTKIYKATPSTWSTISTEDLSGYSETDISNIYDDYVSYGWDILLAQSTGQEFLGYITMYGWAPILPSGSAAGIIYSTYSGGSGKGRPTPMPPEKDDDCEDEDPVDIRTGDYHYRHEDLTIGSQSYPYMLSFKSSYDSSLRLVNGPLGYGWTHNWATSATVGSDGLRGLGIDSPLSAASSIAELFVTLDILGDTTLPVDKLVMVALANQWWVDQMTNNMVTIKMPDFRDLAYILLPDGSYNPPLRDASTLTLVDGAYVHTTPQKVVSNFNTSGQLSSIVWPSGVTINLTYSGGNLESITNNMGRTLTLSYSDGVSVSDGTGRSIKYELDDDDQLIQFTDALSQNYTFAYESGSIGLLTQYFKPQNPANACVTNTYDSLNRVESQVDILGHTTTWYLAGSRSQLIDPVGNSSVVYFDAFGNETELIDALGNLTTFLFDGLGRITQLTQPEGNYFSYAYDAYNNVLTTTMTPKSGSGLSPIIFSNTYNATWNKLYQATDGNGNTTTCSYDPTHGNLVKIQRPAVSAGTPAINRIWNARGQLLSNVDESGVQTQFTYDTTTEKMTSMVLNTNWIAVLGGAITVNDVLTLTAHNSALSGGQESVYYTVVTGDNFNTIAAGLASAVNADSNLSSIGIIAYPAGSAVSLATAAPGNTTTWTATSPGTETITLTAPLNLTTYYGYDSAGNLNSVEDPRGNTTTFQFDNLRRPTLRTEASPFNYQTTYGYDANNNLLTQMRQTGITATPWQTYAWTYSLSDKKSTFTDPAGNAFNWFYDGADRLQKTQDAVSNVYQYAYDQLNRVFTITDPTMVVSETRHYSNNGRLVSVTDASSNTTMFTFDGFDRPNKTIYPDASYEQNLLYDANGNLKTYVTRLGTTIGEIISTYDALNRRLTKAPYGQPSESYSYDLAGRLLSITDSSLGQYQRKFDSAGRFYMEIYPSPDLKTISFSLDASGNVTEIVYPDGYFVSRAYDQLNRLTSITLNGASGPAATFEYDELSRRTALIFSSEASLTYTNALNDDLTNLVNSFSDDEVSFTYSYNKVHQILDQFISDATQSWQPTTSFTDTYGNGLPTGAANNLNEIVRLNSPTPNFSYNNNGCLTGDSIWTHTYDTENHLVSSIKTGTSVSLTYDPFHRQAQKAVTTSGTVSTNYFYSGWQRIADYDATTDTLENRYVYSDKLDEPLIQISSTGTLTFLHADSRGSILATTNNVGAVTNKMTYGPFGETPSLGGTTFGFTGQRFDAETGLYYYKRRYYSPAIGRFLQPDPLHYDIKTGVSYSCGCGCSNTGVSCEDPRPSQLNLYTYTNNDPVNLVDPMGLIASPPAAPGPTTPVAKKDITIEECELLAWARFYQCQLWCFEEFGPCPETIAKCIVNICIPGFIHDIMYCYSGEF